ncbi:MAG: type II secretion system protein [Patescibacteria group bacterium]
MFTKLSKKQKAFTLIELLVVIAIIGVLASIVLASLNTARRKSRDTRRIADLGQIRLALELCFDARCSGEAGYPDAIDEAAQTGVSDIAPTYIGSLPQDPNGGDYAYENLVDGAAGGVCDVADANDCLGYHIGAELEETTNNALLTDASKGPTATWGFDGEDANCDTTDGIVADQCYDIVN